MEFSSVPLFVATLAIFGLAFVVARASSGRAMHRWLVALLCLEGVSLLALGIETLYVPFLAQSRQSQLAITFAASPWFAVAGYVGRDLAIPALSFVYLGLLSFLDTPLSRWLRHGWAKLLVGIVIIVSSLGDWSGSLSELRGNGPANVGDIYLVGALVGLFALACSLHALRRAPRGSPERRRGQAFAVAFGAHDVTTIGGFVMYALADSMADGGRLYLFPYYPLLVSAGSVAFAGLLAYGFLRTQLFDIDLKIKVGIERSTVFTFFALVVIVTQRVVDHYVSSDYGWLAAIGAAIIMFFAKARLDVLANRVADRALPQVKPTTDYIAFKKLEVYKAAVESAHEAGGIDTKERALLDALRSKLSLSASDCAAVESDILGAQRPDADTRATAPS